MASGYKSIPSQTVAASFVRTNTFKQVADFANIFKAFIGTNWLGIPFAFKQSGVLLGVAGVLLVALVTDHCCQLIIKCKTAAVKRTVEIVCKAENMDVDAEDLQELQDKIERKIMYCDIGRMTLGKLGVAMVNCALLITQFFFCTGYFIFLGTTIASLFPMVNIQPHHISGNSSLPHHNHSANGTIFLEDESRGDSKSTAPAFPLLLLVPLFPLIFMAFIRNVRKLGPISFLANIALLVAFLSVIGYMLNGVHFKFSELKMANWATFPVFLGQVTSAYEGIGTIIPIETSMAENRRRFPMYLHLTIALLSLILGGFGILGYFVYGDDVTQIVTENVTSGVLSIMIRVLLCLAILFTYPLQLVPVIRILESWLFPTPKENVPAKSVLDRKSPDVQMPYDESQVDSISTANDSTAPLFKSQTGAKTGRSKIRTWKKNALRTLLVVSSAAIAIVLKHDFAYMSAITGAIGSSMLAFILPCIFHLVLFKQTIHPLVVLKDILIILFGIVGGLVGLYVVIEQLVKQFS